MHSIRSRPRCRAHNTFSPSIALWQYFIAPNQCIVQWQLKSSFATEAARSRDDGKVGSNEENGALALEDRSEPFTVKKVKTGKGNWSSTGRYSANQELGEQRQRSFRKGLRPGSLQDAEKLLIKAREAYNSAQDYQGVTVQPIRTRVPVKESKLPWVPRDWEHIKSAEDRLNLEIQAFHDYIRPNRAESIARKHVIEQVRQHVGKILPEYVLEVFGSERTGIAFAGSDIDLRLVPKDVVSNAAQAKLPPNFEERAKRRRDLRLLHSILLERHRYDYILPRIRWARYPLISLQDRASGLDVQIVLSNDTSTSRELMQRYMTEYKYLPQIYSVIKASMDIRGLSDVFRGGLGSYSLFMMIVASLKHKPHPRNDAGGALTFFLRFWSSFKSEEHGVSIEPAIFFDKSEQLVMHGKAMGHIEQGKIHPLPPWMLTLRDPVDETNDLGRKAIAWKHVWKTFRNLGEKLRTDYKANTRPSLLASHVGPIYMLHQARRKKLTEYGRHVATEGGKYAGIGDFAAASSVATETVQRVTGSTARRDPALEELDAIARAIRAGETTNEESACKADALAVERGASQTSGDDGINPWLNEVEDEFRNQETGQALSDLLCLDKKRDANKQS